MIEDRRDEEEFQEEGRFRRWGREGWEILKILAVSVAIVLPIRYFIAQPFIVRGASMEPNFHNQEYLVVDELSYFLREPQRGEAIVLRFPRDPRQFFIKRVIGLPRERIEIRQGRVKIINEDYSDGFLLDEPYLVPPNRATHPDLTITLGENKFFVLGDNRDFSSDSRVWGELPRNLIIGRAVFRAWPMQRFGLVPDYGVEY